MEQIRPSDRQKIILIQSGQPAKNQNAIIILENPFMGQTPLEAMPELDAPSNAPIIELLKASLIQLRDPHQPYSIRVTAMLNSWRSMARLIRAIDKKTVHNVITFVIRHTIIVVLMTEWAIVDDRIVNAIKWFMAECLPYLDQAGHHLFRCHYLLEYIRKPWSHTAMDLILSGSEPETLTVEQRDNVKNFLLRERGCVLEMRIKQLCDSSCLDLARNLAEHTVYTIRQFDDVKHCMSDIQFSFIFDFYLAMMVKYRQTDRCVEELKKFTIKEAYLFLLRCPPVNQTGSVCRLQKYYEKLAKLALQMFLMNIMSTPVVQLVGSGTGEPNETIVLTIDDQKYFNEICRRYVQMYASNEHFTLMLKELTSVARQSLLFYSLADCIIQICPKQYQTLVMEMYVRAMTVELNELELLKADVHSDERAIMEYELKIAPRYLMLSQILETNHNLARECVLTAFSMNPTPDTLQLVEVYSKALVGFDEPSCSTSVSMNKLPDECQQHTRTTTNHNSLVCFNCNGFIETVPKRIDALHSVTGDALLRSESYDVMKAPSMVLDSDIVSPHIRADFANLISLPRVKTLSWVLGWDALKQKCQQILYDQGKLQFVSNWTATANDNLQFLNVDYDKYKHLPAYEYPGVESGYEVYEDDDEDNDYMNDLNEVYKDMLNVDVQEINRRRLANEPTGHTDSDSSEKEVILDLKMKYNRFAYQLFRARNDTAYRKADKPLPDDTSDSYNWARTYRTEKRLLKRDGHIPVSTTLAEFDKILEETSAGNPEERPTIDPLVNQSSELVAIMDLYLDMVDVEDAADEFSLVKENVPATLESLTELSIRDIIGVPPPPPIEPSEPTEIVPVSEPMNLLQSCIPNCTVTIEPIDLSTRPVDNEVKPPIDTKPQLVEPVVPGLKESIEVTEVQPPTEQIVEAEALQVTENGNLDEAKSTEPTKTLKIILKSISDREIDSIYRKNSTQSEPKLNRIRAPDFAPLNMEQPLPLVRTFAGNLMTPEPSQIIVLPRVKRDEDKVCNSKQMGDVICVDQQVNEPERVIDKTPPMVEDLRKRQAESVNRKGKPKKRLEPASIQNSELVIQTQPITVPSIHPEPSITTPVIDKRLVIQLPDVVPQKARQQSEPPKLVPIEPSRIIDRTKMGDVNCKLKPKKKPELVNQIQQITAPSVVPATGTTNQMIDKRLVVQLPALLPMQIPEPSRITDKTHVVQELLRKRKEEVNRKGKPKKKPEPVNQIQKITVPYVVPETATTTQPIDKKLVVQLPLLLPIQIPEPLRIIDKTQMGDEFLRKRNEEEEVIRRGKVKKRPEPVNKTEQITIPSEDPEAAITSQVIDKRLVVQVPVLSELLDQKVIPKKSIQKIDPLRVVKRRGRPPKTIPVPTDERAVPTQQITESTIDPEAAIQPQIIDKQLIIRLHNLANNEIPREKVVWRTEPIKKVVHPELPELPEPSMDAEVSIAPQIIDKQLIIRLHNLTDTTDWQIKQPKQPMEVPRPIEPSIDPEMVIEPQVIDKRLVVRLQKIAEIPERKIGCKWKQITPTTSNPQPVHPESVISTQIIEKRTNVEQQDKKIKPDTSANRKKLKPNGDSTVPTQLIKKPEVVEMSKLSQIEPKVNPIINLKLKREKDEPKSGIQITSNPIIEIEEDDDEIIDLCEEEVEQGQSALEFLHSVELEEIESEPKEPSTLDDPLQLPPADYWRPPIKKLSKPPVPAVIMLSSDDDSSEEELRPFVNFQPPISIPVRTRGRPRGRQSVRDMTPTRVMTRPTYGRLSVQPTFGRQSVQPIRLMTRPATGRQSVIHEMPVRLNVSTPRPPSQFPVNNTTKPVVKEKINRPPIREMLRPANGRQTVCGNPFRVPFPKFPVKTAVPKVNLPPPIVKRRAMSVISHRNPTYQSIIRTRASIRSNQPSLMINKCMVRPCSVRLLRTPKPVTPPSKPLCNIQKRQYNEFDSSSSRDSSDSDSCKSDPSFRISSTDTDDERTAGKRHVRRKLRSSKYRSERRSAGEQQNGDGTTKRSTTRQSNGLKEQVEGMEMGRRLTVSLERIDRRPDLQVSNNPVEIEVDADDEQQQNVHQSSVCSDHSYYQVRDVFVPVMETVTLTTPTYITTSDQKAIRLPIRPDRYTRYRVPYPIPNRLGMGPTLPVMVATTPSTDSIITRYPVTKMPGEIGLIDKLTDRKTESVSSIKFNERLKSNNLLTSNCQSDKCNNFPDVNSKLLRQRLANILRDNFGPDNRKIRNDSKFPIDGNKIDKENCCPNKINEKSIGDKKVNLKLIPGLGNFDYFSMPTSHRETIVKIVQFTTKSGRKRPVTDTATDTTQSTPPSTVQSVVVPVTTSTQLLQIISPTRHLTKQLTNGNITLLTTTPTTVTSQIPTTIQPSLNPNNLYLCKTDGKMIHLTPLATQTCRLAATQSNETLPLPVPLNNQRTETVKLIKKPTNFIVNCTAGPSNHRKVVNFDGNPAAILPKFGTAFGKCLIATTTQIGGAIKSDSTVPNQQPATIRIGQIRPIITGPMVQQTVTRQTENVADHSTMEQLREFDAIMEQVKERSSVEPVKVPDIKPVPKGVKSPPKVEASPPSAGTATSGQKPQEDEQTVQRIYDILAEYAEQLCSAPDLHNKPAPRRRSNPIGTTTVSESTIIRKPRKSVRTATTISRTSDIIQPDSDSSCGTSVSVDSTDKTISPEKQQPKNVLIATPIDRFDRQSTVIHKLVMQPNGNNFLLPIVQSRPTERFVIQVPTSTIIKPEPILSPVVSNSEWLIGDQYLTVRSTPTTVTSSVVTTQPRELRLQKSLSEECEDLGVGEPMTSELFPDVSLFDSTPIESPPPHDERQISTGGEVVVRSVIQKCPPATNRAAGNDLRRRIARGRGHIMLKKGRLTDRRLDRK